MAAGAGMQLGQLQHARVLSAAPKVALAAGYDVEAALE